MKRLDGGLLGKLLCGMASSTMKELIKCFKSIGLRKLILLYQDILFLLILLFHTRDISHGYDVHLHRFSQVGIRSVLRWLSIIINTLIATISA